MDWGEGMDDILDKAVETLAADDYNHVSLRTLRRRMDAIRQTSVETALWEDADTLIRAVRDALHKAGDPEYGPKP
jgi:hypothetical protein